MTRDQLEKLHHTLIDSGKLIEAGFVSLRIACIDPTSPDVQVNEMRMAFFAGAQHVFSTLMITLDEGEEPTERDLNRMSLIEAELQKFIQEFESRNLPTTGRA